MMPRLEHCLHGHGLRGFIQCFAKQINENPAYEGFEPYQPRVKDILLDSLARAMPYPLPLGSQTVC